MRTLLWQISDVDSRRRNTNYIGWIKMTAYKEEGRLGFKDIQSFNNAQNNYGDS